MKRSATVLPLQRSGEEKPSWKEEKSPLFKSLRGLSFRRASESVGKTKESNKEFTITHLPDRPARRITEAEIPSEEECKAYLMNVRKASIAEQLQRRQQEHQFQPFQYQYHQQQQQQQKQQQQAPIWNHRYLEPEPSWQPQRPTGIPAISKPLPLLPCEEIISALDLELINKRIIRQVNGYEVPDSEEFELPPRHTGEDPVGITRSYSPCPFIGEAKQVKLERLDSVSVSVSVSPAASQASTPRRRSREWIQPQPIHSGRASPKTVVIRRPSRCATTLSPAPRHGGHDGRQNRGSVQTQESGQSDVKRTQQPQPQMGQSPSPTKTTNPSRFSCSNMAPIARFSPTGSPTCTIQEWMPLLASPPPPPPKVPPPASPKTVFTRRPSQTMDPLNSHPVQVRIRQDSIAEPLCRMCNAEAAEQSGVCQRCEDEDSTLNIGEDPYKQQYGKQSRPYPQFHKKYPRPLPLLSHSSGSLATVQRLDNSPSLSPETDTASPPASLRSNSDRMVQTVLTINEPPPPSPLSALSPFEAPRQRKDSDSRSNLYKDKWADYYFDEENFDEDRVDRVGNALTTVEMDELVAKI